MQSVALLVSALVVCSGFSVGSVPAYRPSSSIVTVVASDGLASNGAAAPKVAVASEAADRLWMGAGKPLLRIGKSGAGSTHANGLADLCGAHPYVNVRLTGATTSAALEHLMQILMQAAAADNAKSLTLLATRKPRKGGVEALFSQSRRAEEVCSPEYHIARQLELAQAVEREMSDAVTYKDVREAKAARLAIKTDKVESKTGKPRRHRAAGSAPLSMSGSCGLWAVGRPGGIRARGG